MRILVLGGTAWLGGVIASSALARGHDVTCLARGESGSAPTGARLVAVDRADPAAYDAVRDHEWDEVVDVSWQPGFVRGAVAAIGPRARHWSYVSSCSVYAEHSTPGADESAVLLPALDADTATYEEYGEAKVACEQACRAAVSDRLLIARAGLISGPGDRSDRFGAWVARFARAADSADARPVLIPDDPDLPAQAIDVRDLAGWLLDRAEAGATGAYNVCGVRERLGEVIDISRELAGYDGPEVLVDPEWLAGTGIEEYMGPESVPLWLHDASYGGFNSRDTTAVEAAGLTRRPIRDTLADTLVCERELGLDRERRAGLSLARERELLDAWAARG